MWEIVVSWAAQAMTWLQIAYDQLLAKEHVIRYAGIVGTILSTSWAFWRLWRLREPRSVLYEKDVQYSIERPESDDDRRIVLEQRRRREVKAASIKKRRPATVDPMMANFAEIKKMIQSEGRRGAIWGFVQNLVFFLLGTVTSILVPKFFP